MQPDNAPSLLVTEREGALFLERARIHASEGRVVYHLSDDEQGREHNIPHANLAVLFLGQGASISQEAMRLLGDEAVHVAVTGDGGTPLHLGTLTSYSATRHFLGMLPLYQSEEKSFEAARAIMLDRAARMRSFGATGAQRWLRLRDVSSILRITSSFEAEIAGCEDLDDLFTIEVRFSEALHADFARLSGLSRGAKFRRVPRTRKGPGDDAGSDAARDVNELIDHGTTLCNGMVGAALWALGIPPHLSIIPGKTRPGGLVLDLAESFKDALVLPLAFASVMEGAAGNPEEVFRTRLISAFDDRRILREAIMTVERMITPGTGKVLADA